MNLDYNHLLSEINEKKVLFSKFTRQFQNELFYLQAVIKIDEKSVREASSWFSCFTKKKDRQTIIKQQTEKLNQPFYKIIQKMKHIERYFFFEELLNMLGFLVDLYEDRILSKDIKSFDINVLKQFKEELHMELQDQYLSVEAAEQIPIIEQSTIYLITEIDGFQNERVVRVEQNTLLFIYKISKVENKTRVDLRNYILLEHVSENKFPFILQAVYKCVEPMVIKMNFYSPKEREMLLMHIRQVVKAGKIERLVNSLDLEGLIFNGKLPKMPKNKRESLFAQALLEGGDSASDQQEYFDTNLSSRFVPNSGKHSKYKKLSMFKKQSQLNFYSEIKQKLIQALNELAAKKNEHNQLVKQFLYKDLKINQKVQSQELIEALQNQEAKIKINDSQVDIEESDQYEEDDFNCLSITVRKQQKQRDDKKDKEENKSEESSSFRHTNLQFVDQTDHPLQSSPVIRDNVYSNMYPAHHLSLFTNNSDYKDVNFTNKIWAVPVDYASQEQIEDEVNSKVMNQKMRIFQHKIQNNTYKITFIVKIRIASTVQILSNVTLWYKWHPNIEEINIIQYLKEQNSIRVLIIGKTQRSKFELPLKIHLFKIESKYFLAMKSEKKENQRQKTRTQSFFSLFGFGSSLLRNYNYLLFILQNTGVKQNNCQISINAQFNPTQLSKISGLVKEQLSFLINFSYLDNYWKLKEDHEIDFEEEKQQKDAVLKANYTVKKNEIALKQYN